MIINSIIPTLLSKFATAVEIAVLSEVRMLCMVSRILYRGVAFDDGVAGDGAGVGASADDPSVGPESAAETSTSTLLHRCRFAHAVNSLQKSGLIQVKSRGEVITRQVFTWIDNSG